MKWKDFFDSQADGMRSMASVGLIGLHLASGPIVGFLIGFGLDYWLKISPWGKLIFFFIGILAGFLNVWRDTRELLAKIDKKDLSPHK